MASDAQVRPRRGLWVAWVVLGPVFLVMAGVLVWEWLAGGDFSALIVTHSLLGVVFTAGGVDNLRKRV